MFAATSAKLTSQIPPVAASASTAGCCHWLAPSTAHGPPRACQDRIHSLTSHQLGSTTTAASARSGVTGSRSSSHAAAPRQANGAPMTIATSSQAGPRFGISQYSAASR